MIDFGVARAFGRVAHTSPGGLKGKIDYMSPEQASAEEVDHRADVFALGVVLWEALTGRRLFRRETELATMRAIVDDPIPHPSEMRRHPAELDAIVMRALRKRKDARFASAQEMAVALEKFAFSSNGFSPMQVAGLHEVAVRRRVPAVAEDGDRGAGSRGGEATRVIRAGMAGLGAEPPTAGPTMTLRPGVSWQEGRSEMRSASGRSRSRSSPSQGQPTRGSQSSYSQAADGRRPASGRVWAGQARSHLAVRRGRRAAGHRRRRRLDGDAPPGDPRRPAPVAGAPAADADPAVARPSRAARRRSPRTSAARVAAQARARRRARRRRGARDRSRTRARPTPRRATGASAANEIKVEQRSRPCPASAPNGRTTTRRKRPRPPATEAAKKPTPSRD